VTNHKKISVIIPCYNEESNIAPFFGALERMVKKQKEYSFDIIYVNDGSSDHTLAEIHKLAENNSCVVAINLSRNFGKEIATTAGIHKASGDAIIMIDADGQHPPELIPKLLKEWKNGAQVVVGVRKSNQKEGVVKRYGSKIFYKLFNSMTEAHLVPGATDFRLIDHVVRSEFIRMTERNRITRGLIDWLGFRHAYVEFNANERLSGNASYSIPKLVKLALTSFVSLSLKPLYFSVYAGLVILPLSTAVLIFSIVETLIGDPLSLEITGSAYLVLVTLFLLGVLLVSQGIIAIYLSHIHTETQNRPLFIIDETTSKYHTSTTIEKL
jgi:dolichol-phosphate mannosyltransferase